MQAQIRTQDSMEPGKETAHQADRRAYRRTVGTERKQQLGPTSWSTSCCACVSAGKRLPPSTCEAGQEAAEQISRSKGS